MPEVVYDAAAALAVLHAAAEDRQARRIVVRSLTESDFVVTEQAEAWRLLRRLEEEGVEFDPDVARRIAAEVGVSDGSVALLEREHDAPARSLAWLVDRVRWDGARARATDGPLAELIEAISDIGREANDVRSAARRLARSLDAGGRRYVQDPGAVLRGYRAEVAVRRSNPGIDPFGFDVLDAGLSRGSRPGLVTLVVGLSGSAKSTLVANQVVRQVVRYRRKILYGVWEMGTHDTLDLLVSIATQIPLANLDRGELTDAESDAVTKAAAFFARHVTFFENPFFVPRDSVDSGKARRWTNDDNLDVLEGYLAETDADLFVADLWDRLYVDLSYEGTTRALFRAQQMAKEYGIHLELVMQILLKEVERRKDKRPTRDAIKGTGAAVEVADNIFGVHWEAAIKNVPDSMLEVLVMKQRKGKSRFAVGFDFEPETASVHGEGRLVSYDPSLEDLDDVAAIRT